MFSSCELYLIIHFHVLLSVDPLLVTACDNILSFPLQLSLVSEISQLFDIFTAVHQGNILTSLKVTMFKVRRGFCALSKEINTLDP